MNRPTPMSHDLCMFRFIITFAMINKAHEWRTFSKCKAKLDYCLIQGSTLRFFGYDFIIFSWKVWEILNVEKLIKILTKFSQLPFIIKVSIHTWNSCIILLVLGPMTEATLVYLLMMLVKLWCWDLPNQGVPHLHSWYLFESSWWGEVHQGGFLMFRQGRMQELLDIEQNCHWKFNKIKTKFCLGKEVGTLKGLVGNWFLKEKLLGKDTCTNSSRGHPSHNKTCKCERSGTARSKKAQKQI